MIKKISLTLQQILQIIFDDSFVGLTIDYIISQQSAIDWSPNQVYDSIKNRLGELRDAELRVGQSLVGPHKHDVRFLLYGQDSRFCCSQGQQRALVLALKVALVLKYYEVHKDYPVLLLDDVFSELDSKKSEGLWGILRDLPAQIFLATTEYEKQEFFRGSETNVFTVKNGRIW